MAPVLAVHTAWIGIVIDVNPSAWMRSARLPLLVVAALVVASGLYAARVTWLLVSPPDGVPETASPSLSTAAHTPALTPGAQAAQLAGWGLFGRSAPSHQSIDPVQSSSLGLRLEGIISGSTPPLVMLGIGNSVKLLQVGASISPQVTVHAIEPDRVILSNQGRLESIRFPPAVALNSAKALSAEPIESPSTGTQSSGSTPSLPPPSLQGMIRNPGVLSRYVTLTPLKRGGTLAGYVLRPMPGQGAFLTRLGLVSGDILTQVNGMPVTDPALLPHLMPQLNAGAAIPVTVERNGHPMQMTINMDSLR